ncbi:MAG TPA: Uma2 family endonuclease [Acetobacteraceae bacterium]
MNVTLRPRLTKHEFLAWEERQELRYEFDGHKVTAMVGATQAHELTVAGTVIALGVRLRGGPCRVFGSGIKIEVAGSIRYPDATVACEPVQRRERLLTDPLFMFEVESDSTALLDQTVKNPE